MSAYKFLIVGAGGFGREVYGWLTDWIARSTQSNDYEISGFLDDSASALEGFTGLPPVISSIDEYQHQGGVLLVCAIANPKIKKSIAEKMKTKGACFFSLIHPTAIVGARVTLGDGVVICPNAVLSTDIAIGDFVTINVGSTVGHDAFVGSFSTISGHCDVTGGVKLAEGVFMGSHAVVAPKVSVGAYAVIGAASVAIRKVAPGVTVFGVPAKRISG